MPPCTLLGVDIKLFLQRSQTNPVVKQRGEPRVPGGRALVAQRGAPGQALDAGREVAVGEDVRQAEGGVVHTGELGQEDLRCSMQYRD